MLKGFAAGGGPSPRISACGGVLAGARGWRAERQPAARTAISAAVFGQS